MSYPAKAIVNQTVITADVQYTAYTVVVSQIGPAKVTVSTGLPGATGPQGPAGTSRPTKAGFVAGASFTGSPKKYAVVFATPFVDANFALALSGTDGRDYTYESKTPSGFTINSNAATAISGEVSWTAMTIGET